MRTGAANAADAVRFTGGVRPLLARRCFGCHGPDEDARKGGLRLDTRDGMLADRDGSRAVVPGKPAASALFERVTDPSERRRMPPAKAGPRLSEAEVELLRRWIELGAPWDEHWSLVPPRPRPLPETPRRDDSGADWDSGSDWPRTPVDSFIFARLEAEGLRPAPEADRITLLRRLSLDLTGLPPAADEVDRFLADGSPDAVERNADRLLASPRHGERLAVWWLDLVRYADSVGYHSDVERRVSPYRDYVIDAFNSGMPFDRFTVEQLAGDLLPGAGTEQRVAAAYNVLNRTTEEGGAQAREYLARHAADRVRTTAGVWMAATLGCAECHDHKYDPYTTRDFYSLAALFADFEDKGVGTPEPKLLVPSAAEAERLQMLDAAIDAARSSGAGGAADGGSGPPAVSPEVKALEEEKATLLKSLRRTISPVLVEPRPTRVLGRGDWLDDSGEVVEPAVPSVLGRLDTGGRRATRLDLARWLVSGRHPQTGRVVVNRLWKLLFGAGIARNLDDLGTQGGPAAHPELLDWLAVEFVESGWDLKHALRRLASSSAYQQSSRVEPEALRRDPQNRLLARQTRWRLDAEFVRDGALLASGLLVHKLGGESVRPYQPAGYWSYLNFPKRDYVPSRGADQYRRGLYTHWQRTFLHPSLLAFDAATREECTAERPVSNTPLAALALLNDPTYVEAARAFAERVLREGPPSPRERVEWAWRTALSRPPLEEEAAALLELFERHRRVFDADREAARGLLSVGFKALAPGLDEAELAAWTSVARAILNLDEAISRY
jgi:hypothetical protein